MRLTLYRTLWIHTLLLVGLGGYWLTHRREYTQTAALKQVRMPTLAELLEIERLGEAIRGPYVLRDPADLDRRLRSLIDLQLGYMPPEHPEVVKNRTALAQFLARNGDYAKAAVEYRILLKVYQRVMGADEPETLECQRNLAQMLRLANKAE